MLTVIFRPHRPALRAGTAEPQKLFAMLKLIPTAEVAQTRPTLALVLVIDTSSSMRESAGGTDTKLERAIRAAHSLLDNANLAPEDQIAVVHFDEQADVVLPLCPLSRRGDAHQAIDSLANYSGGTLMAKGLRLAQQQLAALPPQHLKRVILLTDGETFDEPECRPLARELGGANTAVVALGLGLEYNQQLLLDVGEATQGRHYHFLEMGMLDSILETEIGALVREVVTDLQATVPTVKGTSLDSIARVYPSLSEAPLGPTPYRMGNVAAGDFTVFLLEFTVGGMARPPSRARLAQIGLAGHAPALGRREEFPVQELQVTFTTDESDIARIDPEVMGYVQQKNSDRMVGEAVRLATVDAGRARQTLMAAKGMTQRLGNEAMTRMLDSALDELNQTGAISEHTRRTIRAGGRTMTIKVGGTPDAGAGISPEDIRRLSGT